MKKLLVAAFLALGLSQAEAQNATTVLTIVVNGPLSTSITCPLGTYNAPLAAGSLICNISVLPTGWSGTIALSGANASSFALSGLHLNVGATALAAGTYTVTLTATP